MCILLPGARHEAVACCVFVHCRHRCCKTFSSFLPSSSRCIILLLVFVSSQFASSCCCLLAGVAHRAAAAVAQVIRQVMQMTPEQISALPPGNQAQIYQLQQQLIAASTAVPVAVRFLLLLGPQLPAPPRHLLCFSASGRPLPVRRVKPAANRWHLCASSAPRFLYYCILSLRPQHLQSSATVSLRLMDCRHLAGSYGRSADVSRRACAAVTD